MKFKLSLLLTFFSFNLFAETIDEYLHARFNIFSMTTYETLPVNNADDYIAKVELGQRLFMDTGLSGNKNISCLTCHHPLKGLSDNLALSQTQDGKGVLRRNSSSLFNIGDKSNHHMFWDGRVQYIPSKKSFSTPEVALNGPTPSALNITSVMQSALAAQAIFPLVSHEEMRGNKGDNEIADAATNLEAWDLLVDRILTKRSSSKKYVELFNRAFPEVASGVQQVNIGHAGEAMAAFMREKFQSTNSPFNRYLAGDDAAMTTPQKRGLKVFMDQGCVACHSGNLLGSNSFFASVGVPSFGAAPFTPDRGRGEVNNERFRSFFFKTPSLINVGLSGPYMHNGAFKTIREVLNHYNNIEKSLNEFDITARKTEFPVAVEVRNKPADINAIWASITAGFLRNGLQLREQELNDLEVFLTEGLTDPKWNPEKVPADLW